MSNDLANSDVAGPLHYDLLVKWLADSKNIRFWNDVEKGARLDEGLKTVFRRVFLEPR
jgi:hypothetical protein